MTTSYAEKSGCQLSQPGESARGGAVDTVTWKRPVGSRMPLMRAVFSCQLWLLTPSTIRTFTRLSTAEGGDCAKADAEEATIAAAKSISVVFTNIESDRCRRLPVGRQPPVPDMIGEWRPRYACHACPATSAAPAASRCPPGSPCAWPRTGWRRIPIATIQDTTEISSARV
jgi:hypothetical protein